MPADSCEYEYQLDNQFFADLEVSDIQKGEVGVSLKVKKTSGIYQLDFHTKGLVMVTCDRCLDEMEQPVESIDRLRVKLGEAYDETDDMITVSELEGCINVAWFIYEFIALSIPMKHVHAPGNCNKEMVSKLSRHLRTSADDDEEEDDFVLSEEEESMDEPKGIDPRWSELKKILDNN